MKKETNTNIDKLIHNYFEKEKRIEKGDLLEEKLIKSLQKQTFTQRIKRFAIPIAATILIGTGIIYTFLNHTSKKNKISESQIIYQDDDFMIYVQE